MSTWIETALVRGDLTRVVGNLTPTKPVITLFRLTDDQVSDKDLAGLAKDVKTLAGALNPHDVEISGSGEILIEEDGNLYGVPVLLVSSFALCRLRNIIEDELMGSVIAYDRTSGFLPHIAIEGAWQLNGKATVRVEGTFIVQEANGTRKTWEI